MNRKLISFYKENPGILNEGLWYIRFAYYDDNGRYISGASEEAHIPDDDLYSLVKKYLKRDKG